MAVVFDGLDAARDQMERVKGLVAQVGLRYDDLGPVPSGVGVGVAFDEARFLVLSVPDRGTPGQLLVTAGVVRDIVDDRRAALEFCNARTAASPAFPCLVHRADTGTDILVQQCHPIQLLVRQPDYFGAVLDAMPAYAARLQAELAAGTALGGWSYRWPDDAGRLLSRSLLAA